MSDIKISIKFDLIIRHAENFEPDISDPKIIRENITKALHATTPPAGFGQANPRICNFEIAEETITRKAKNEN